MLTPEELLKDICSALECDDWAALYVRLPRLQKRLEAAEAYIAATEKHFDEHGWFCCLAEPFAKWKETLND